ncbi:hypothetical protein SDRG_14778 [Saprolegnia diclina VS20]|uniref:RCC1-like domain-containing protein n=1 Tax=Saprolegnia diclina (strain VS20) TaxID=1156394 RepID=T0PPU7_SAPDV|nr:hypothetical protein SDRG_14778 [Saprolegnia diclina VS20]EQC27454.1 hypothetical protein SDRG_14778 [Saprolegnia diclina VS20]|eukprot:XP_008619154.1 hypothetical protein SDRG_14778 [Saprolegnia diclina VS20]
MTEPSPRGRLSSRLLQASANIQASFHCQPPPEELSNNDEAPVQKRNAVCILPDFSALGLAGPTYPDHPQAFGGSSLVHVSKLQVEAIYGGSMGFYTLVLTTACVSPVVVHIMVQSDRSRAVRITTSRICFTPKTYHIPQAVGVYAVDVTRDAIAVVHRVYSQDERFDQAFVPSVQVAVFGNEASYVWTFGGDAALLPPSGARRGPHLVSGFAHAANESAGRTENQEASQPAVDGLLEDHDIYFSSIGAGDTFTVVVSSQSCLAYTYGQATLGDHTNCGSTTAPQLLLASTFFSAHEKPAIASLSCGQHHVAVITRAGLLFTWGSGRFGQLGHSSYLDILTPRRVDFTGLLTKAGDDASKVVVKSVACGGQHTLVITDLQQVLAFGHNKAGQLGLGHRNCRTESGWRSCTPSVISTLTMHSVHQVAAGYHHSACITTQGELYTWGCGVDGRLGTNSTTTRDTPAIVHALKTLDVVPKIVRCGGRHTCIVTATDELYTWGANDFGQLGLGDTRARSAPTLVTFPSSTRVLDVSLGQFHSAAVTTSGDVYTWGYDVNGGLGLPDALDVQPAPVLLTAFSGLAAVQVQCGWSHTTVLTKRKVPGRKTVLAQHLEESTKTNVLATLQHIVSHQIPSRPQSARPYQPTPRQVELARTRQSVASFHDRMARVRPHSARLAPPPTLSVPQRLPRATKPVFLKKKKITKKGRPATAPPKRAAPKSPTKRPTAKPPAPLQPRPQSACPRRNIFVKKATPRLPPPMTPRELRDMTRTVLHELNHRTPCDDDDNNLMETTSKWTFLTACTVTTDAKPKRPKPRVRATRPKPAPPAPLALQLDKAKLRSRWERNDDIQSVLKEKQKEHPRLWLR